MFHLFCDSVPECHPLSLFDTTGLGGDLMNAFAHSIATAADILVILEQTDLSPVRRRDLSSGVRRMCSLLGCHPAALSLNIPDLRRRIVGIRPAAHGITQKTFSTLRSNFVAAL